MLTLCLQRRCVVIILVTLYLYRTCLVICVHLVCTEHAWLYQRCQVIRTEQREISHYGCNNSWRHRVLQGESAKICQGVRGHAAPSPRIKNKTKHWHLNDHILGYIKLYCGKHSRFMALLKWYLKQRKKWDICYKKRQIGRRSKKGRKRGRFGTSVIC